MWRSYNITKGNTACSVISVNRDMLNSPPYYFTQIGTTYDKITNRHRSGALGSCIDVLNCWPKAHKISGISDTISPAQNSPKILAAPARGYRTR